MKWIAQSFTLFAGLSLFVINPSHAERYNPLKDYVYAYDSAYNYRLVSQRSEDGFDVYTINLDSQKWRSAEEVSPVLWNHWLTLIVPDQITTSMANIVVHSGNSDSGVPDIESFGEYRTLAIQSGSIQAILQQVPAQPLTFTDLDEAVQEDALVSYSWRKVMETGDPTWSAYLPMTKAVVRGMDTTQKIVEDKLGFEIEQFIVTGFSKRGAIAWLTAAIDPRVSGVIPGGYNILYLDQQLEHHFNSYGFYSEALANYSNKQILQEIRSPEGKFLRSLIDPVSYRHTLNMPHLILNVTGDEFFLPDASEAYIDKIPGETLQRIIPNTNHSFLGHEEEMMEGLTAWYQMIVNGFARPQIDWEHDESGSLVVHSDLTPLEVRLWQANNPHGRDFRFPTVGDEAWHSTLLEVGQDGSYRISVPIPDEGYTAYMAELTYPDVFGKAQVYTTSVFIVPDKVPFELGYPISEPKTASYWSQQVESALLGEPLDYSADELMKMLPFFVLGEQVEDVEGLDEFLSASAAKQNCTAARLNVEAGELGWYSSIHQADANVKYWQVYDWAERLYVLESRDSAAVFCRELTQFGRD
ncbi:MAG: PhoPQ-activated protein PqaA family protein [Candidatus Thiodiazotropha sp. 6PLUC9]